jgi:energy-converting hydrogenase Eha subunit C
VIIRRQKKSTMHDSSGKRRNALPYAKLKSFDVLESGMRMFLPARVEYDIKVSYSSCFAHLVELSERSQQGGEECVMLTPKIEVVCVVGTTKTIAIVSSPLNYLIEIVPVA